MDLRNFCSKVDVDTIRAKIPPLPQIKLPKSVSKLKSHKIFRISRDDFSSISRRASSKRSTVAKTENIALPLGAPYPIPPSEFIDRTPTRISTISSLMNQNSSNGGGGGKGFRMWQPQNNDDDDENSYRSAGGIDDYYPSPMSQRYEQRMSRPISPVRSPHVTHAFRARSEQNVKMSFGEKLQKSYKDLTEFKFKHLFAKRTVVHADKIEVTNYIHSFDEDRKRDEKVQRKIDRDIADNYRFQFKVSQQKSEESFLDYESPDSSSENLQPMTNRRNLNELSGDESGMESSPPQRTPGIAATRFSRVRHTPLNMSLQDEKYDEDANNEINVEKDINKHRAKSINRENRKQKSPEKYTDSRQNPRKSTQQMSQEEDIDFDDDDIELEEVESPKIKPNKKTQSRQSPRRKSARGIAATVSSRDRNAPTNRTQEEDLDVDIELNVMEEIESPKLKHTKQSLQDNKKHKSLENLTITNSRQNLRMSIKGIASSAFSKDRHGPFNKTQEEELDIDDGDIELNELEEVESPKMKSTKKPIYHNNKKSKSPEKFKDSRQIPRRKSAKGIASSAYSKDRHTSLSKTREEDLYMDDGNFKLNDVEEVESPRIKQSKISFEKSTKLQQNSRRNMSLEEDSNDDDYDMHENIELNVVEEINSPKINHKSNENLRKSKSIKERMARLTKQKLECDESNKGVPEKKRRAPLSPEQSVDNDGARKSEKPFDAIKHNIKRIHKSIKMPRQSGTLSENDDAYSENTVKQSKTQQFSEHLKRFRSTDNVDKTSEDGEYNKSPIHNITNKLQEWKKSIRKKVDSHNVDNEDDYGATSPQRQIKPVGSLIKKLKHIRSRRRDSTDDPDEDEEGGETYKESLASRAKLQLEKGAVAASQMPQKTMKKISETKKFFKKKQDENDGKKKQTITHTDEEELDDGDGRVKTSPKNTAKGIPSRPPPPIPRPYYPSSEEEDDDADNHKFITKSIAESQLIAVPAARAVWTTKPILSDDATDYEEDLPRVVLHQDNSNVFEPTLIIAVTRPISCTTSPIITEFSADSEQESTPDTKPDNWIPNQDKIATFLEMTPPSQRKFSKDANAKANPRKQSIDSSSDDSWIKDIPKGPSTAIHLNNVHENEQPWKIQNGNTDDNLYKTKSIDLFEMQKQHGGVSCAFEDFDDELRYTPVVKIEKEITPVDETETDDNEEFKDFDDEYQTPPVIKIEKEITPADEMETEEFKDFDDELKNAVIGEKNHVVNIEKKITPVVDVTETKNSPVFKIEKEIKTDKDEEHTILKIHRNIDDYQRESSEEFENPDDDNSSRVTKIAVYSRESKDNETTKHKSELKIQSYGNSRESLTGYLDGKDIVDSGEEDDNEESDNDFHAGEEADLPPSKTPSPPPSILPTPPPLPQRKPSLILPSFDCPSIPPPPLPLTKPPLPRNRPIPAPPKIPDRKPATTVSKPLVKTASLRLAYNEQVNPKDIGKVNKLISRFETEVPNRRPRVTPRKPYTTNESEASSEEEDLIKLLPKKQKEKSKDSIMTNSPKMQKSISIDSVDSADKNDRELTKIDILKNNDKKSTPVDALEIQQKSISIDSVSVIDKHYKTPKPNPEIPQKSVYINSIKTDKKPTSIDIPNDNVKKSTPITVPEIQQKSISVDASGESDKKPTPRDMPNNKVKNSIANDFVDVSDKNDKKPTPPNNEVTKSTPIDIPEIQQKSISVDFQDKSDKKSAPIDIPENQQKSISINIVDYPEKNDKTPTLIDIPNNNDKKSTPIDIPGIQQKSISEDSVDTPDKNYKKLRRIDTLETKQKSISIDSIEFPDKNVDEPHPINVLNSHDDIIPIPNDISVIPQNSTCIDLVDITCKNDTKPIPIDIPDNSDNKATLNDISHNNDNKPAPIDISEIEQKTTSFNTPDKNVKKPTPIDNPNNNDNIPTTIDNSNNIENKPIMIDNQNQKDNKSTSTDIQENNDNKSTPIDITDSNGNTPTSIQKIHTSRISIEKTLEIVNDNSGSAEPTSSISISSNCLDINSNFSQPSSVYGSPLAYPSSLVGSPEVTPLAIRKESEYIDTKRTRRNVDDDNFVSLDSDEENSYYSISSTSSNRYVVEL